ncbi:hypothetical protein BD770DRAFT_213006 [Pilaira anomala]|nr:hypothetical protein BD770DRAFT_213006 [Pilaira anomala]
MLHWGDTHFTPCNSSNFRFRADVRIVVMSETDAMVDGATGEVAKKAAPKKAAPKKVAPKKATPKKVAPKKVAPKKAAPKKLFMDKLESVLGTKCHINNFLMTVPYIPSKEIKNVVFPIVQIMGFNVHVCTLRLVNKGLYVVQDFISYQLRIIET